MTLFVVGALCVVFIGMGAKLMTSGTKRSLRARKEQRLEERRQKDEQERSGDHETS